VIARVKVKTSLEKNQCRPLHQWLLIESRDHLSVLDRLAKVPLVLQDALKEKKRLQKKLQAYRLKVVKEEPEEPEDLKDLKEPKK
jgi:hypothetical protein